MWYNNLMPSREFSPVRTVLEPVHSRKTLVETIVMGTAAGDVIVGPFPFPVNDRQRQDVLVSIISKGALNCDVQVEQAVITELDDYTQAELYHPFGQVGQCQR